VTFGFVDRGNARLGCRRFGILPANRRFLRNPFRLIRVVSGGVGCHPVATPYRPSFVNWPMRSRTR
jgi:hypothetical protein